MQANSLAAGGVKAVAAAAAAADAAVPALHRCKIAKRHAMHAASPAEKALVGRKVGLGSASGIADSILETDLGDRRVYCSTGSGCSALHTQLHVTTVFGFSIS